VIWGKRYSGLALCLWTDTPHGTDQLHMLDSEMLASQTDPFDPDRSGLSFYGQSHYISRLGHLMARKQKAASVQASRKLHGVLSNIFHVIHLSQWKKTTTQGAGLLGPALPDSVSTTLCFL
jgi:hypothetical protein